jgi:hypothetical protein
MPGLCAALEEMSAPQKPNDQVGNGCGSGGESNQSKRAAGIAGHGDVGTDLLRCADIGVGSCLVALHPPCEAATEVRLGVVRVESDRLVEVLDRTVVIALVAVGYTAVVEGDGVVRVERDRLVDVLL